MPSELDRKFDAVLAAVTGEGGPFVIGEDAEGRAIVTNLPATLAVLFDAFCMLNGAVEAVVAGEERLTFAELGERSTALARRLAGSWGVAQGRPGRDRDAQLPGLDRRLHGGPEGGRDRDPDQRLVAGGRDAPRASTSAAPELIIADETRAPASEGRRLHDPDRRAAGRPDARRGARAAVRARRRVPICPRSGRRTTPRSCSPRARPAPPRARSRPTARSPPASIATRSASPPCSGSRKAKARPSPTRGPWSTCPCSTSPARCRCCSTAS